MIKKIKSMMMELFTPSNQEEGRSAKVYYRAVVALAHAVLGAALIYALVKIIGFSFLTAGLIVMIGYAFKESLDLRRGGTWRDSVEDGAATAFGVVYAFSPAFPVLAVLLFLVVFLSNFSSQI